MSLIIFLGKIFNIVLTFSYFIAIFTEFPKSGSEEKNNSDYKSESKWIIVYFILDLILFCLIIFLFLHKFSQYNWIVSSFSLSVYTIMTISAIFVLSEVRHNRNGIITNKEKNAIKIIAFYIWLLNNSGIILTAIQCFANISNSIVSDFIIGFFVIFISFIYIFLIVALLPEPIVFLLDIIERVFKKQHSPTTTDKKKVVFKFAPTIENYFNYLKQQSNRMRIIGYLLCPIIFVKDIIVSFVLLIVSLMFGIIEYTINIFKAILKTGFFFVKSKLSSCSNKEVFIFSIRLSIILAFTSVVIFNRYNPIFANVEQSTGALEFLSSAIIIPIIFEWIYSLK